MSKTILTFGPTLARRMEPHQCFSLVDRQFHSEKRLGAVVILVSRSVIPDVLNVDCTHGGLDIDTAIRAADLARERLLRLGGFHAPSYRPDNYHDLRDTAAYLVDLCRDHRMAIETQDPPHGWFARLRRIWRKPQQPKHVFAKLFSNSREACILSVVEALAHTDRKAARNA